MLSHQRKILVSAMAVVLLMALATPPLLEAKSYSGKDRVRFYGLVESMPMELHGTWIISGRQFVTNPSTQFDQTDGPLRPGACVKVDIRSGRVHEIDSEPASNCR